MATINLADGTSNAFFYETVAGDVQFFAASNDAQRVLFGSSSNSYAALAVEKSTAIVKNSMNSFVTRSPLVCSQEILLGVSDPRKTERDGAASQTVAGGSLQSQIDAILMRLATVEILANANLLKRWYAFQTSLLPTYYTPENPLIPISVTVDSGRLVYDSSTNYNAISMQPSHVIDITQGFCVFVDASVVSKSPTDDLSAATFSLAQLRLQGTNGVNDFDNIMLDYYDGFMDGWVDYGNVDAWADDAAFRQNNTPVTLPGVYVLNVTYIQPVGSLSEVRFDFYKNGSLVCTDVGSVRVNPNTPIYTATLKLFSNTEATVSYKDIGVIQGTLPHQTAVALSKINQDYTVVRKSLPPPS